MMEKKTTIWISEEVKETLDKMKIHPRETYEDIIRRLIEFQCQK